MPFTYTYTARNAENPDQAMTFTIVDDTLRVNLTGWEDQVADLMGEDDRDSAIRTFLSKNTGTALFKAVERISGPVHINDVTPSYEDGQFKLTFWKRLAGLRFAPIPISIGHVDNPQAAGDFVATLMDRQDETESPGFFGGPLDYWATWLVGLVGVIVLLRWPKKQPKTDEG